METIKKKSLKGIYPSFLTPLHKDETLDLVGVKKEVDYLLKGGVHGIWVGGTGGEIFGISEDLFLKMVQLIIDEVHGRCPIMANISACGSHLSIQRARKLFDFGIDVVFATPPFYFSYTQEEVINYYRKVANESPLPLIIYNNPYAGGHFDVTPEILKILMDEMNILGIKDSSGVIGRVNALINLRESYNRKDFLIYESWEPFVADSLFKGADGAIMSAATVLPKVCVDLYNQYLTGNKEQVEMLQKEVNEFLEAFIVNGVFPDALFIGGTKACLELLDICSRQTIHPLRIWPQELDNGFRQILKRHKIIGV